MARVCGVKFAPNGKTYNFLPNGLSLNVGDKVVAETSQGIKIATVSEAVREVPNNQLGADLKTIIRIATQNDEKTILENEELSKKAFDLCAQQIEKMGLGMKLFKAEYSLDRSKIVFSYVAESRVDFRELVKALVPELRTRIEMLQVGPREHAKVIGGVGVCGRPFCCHEFMTCFDQVPVKTAKDQGLTNPTKHSGSCGKLLCCLKHEEAAYEYAQKIMPKNGAIVSTPDGIGKIVVTNMLKETCTVKIGLDQVLEIKTFDVKDIRIANEEERALYSDAKRKEHEEQQAIERERKEKAANPSGIAVDNESSDSHADNDHAQRPQQHTGNNAFPPKKKFKAVAGKHPNKKKAKFTQKQS